MHGFARLRLVGTAGIDGIEECRKDDVPGPLPFPTCVRSLPVRCGSATAALEALERVSLSFEKLRAEIERDDDDDAPRAA